MTSPLQSVPASKTICYCKDNSCQIAWGRCHCGCNGKTTIPIWNNTPRGIVGGVPNLFIHHHRLENDPLASFLSKVDKDGPLILPEIGKCWKWKTGKSHDGYGTMRWPTKKSDKSKKRVYINAHRASWLLFRGPIPKSLYVLHRCDNRECTNPDHLFLGNQDDNMKDAAAKNRLPTGIAKGAKFTPTEVQEIRSLYRDGYKCWRIARQYGVSSGTIEKIVAKITYRYLP